MQDARPWFLPVFLSGQLSFDNFIFTLFSSTRKTKVQVCVVVVVASDS